MKLIVLNTIGLTGVEALLARMNSIENVLTLPGQNFAMFNQGLYRPHDYYGKTDDEIFDILNHHLYTKDGRIWMGLTKYMNENLLTKYDPTVHRKLFLKKLSLIKLDNVRNFAECASAYAESYFDLRISGHKKNADFVAIYSANFALNCAQYGSSISRVRVWNVSVNIDTWLASISQTRTWDCIKACKFWLINNLYLEYFKTLHPLYKNVSWEYLSSHPEKVLTELATDLESSFVPNVDFSEGIISPSNEYNNMIKRDAKILRKIYGDEELFILADNLKKWCSVALSDKKILELLKEYEEFWSSTGHTNFDWVGPIGEQLIDHIRAFFNVTKGTNPSLDFFHNSFSIHSDSHNKVEGNLEHYLGKFEEKIIFPFLPYHLRVVMYYLERVAKNYIFHAHSYVPMRQGSLYKRLTCDDARIKIKRFGLEARLQEVENIIDQAEDSCSHLRLKS